MKNKLKSVRRGSKIAAASQLKTAQSGASVQPKSGLPMIALFPKGEEDGMSGEIVDLSKAEYAALKRATAPIRHGVLMFMVNAALEKAGWPGATVTCKFILPDGSEVARVDFPREVFSRIEAAASKLGITLQQFVKNAIHNLIRSEAARRAA